jgi:hypothetical protein
MSEHPQDQPGDGVTEGEARLPDDAIEDLEPTENESIQVAGGAKKLPGKPTPPTVT